MQSWPAEHCALLVHCGLASVSLVHTPEAHTGMRASVSLHVVLSEHGYLQYPSIQVEPEPQTLGSFLHSGTG